MYMFWLKKWAPEKYTKHEFNSFPFLKLPRTFPYRIVILSNYERIKFRYLFTYLKDGGEG